MFTNSAPIGEVFMKKVRKEPFALPVEPDAPTIDFVVGLKQDAPFEYCAIGGINFEKRVFPNKASISKNIGKTFYPRKILRKLTKNQYNALLEEAKKRDFFIPMTRNENYDSQYNPKDDPRGEHIEKMRAFNPAYTVKVGDWIILEPAATYDPRKYEPDIQEKKFHTFETLETENALINAQRGEKEEPRPEPLDAQKNMKKGK